MERGWRGVGEGGLIFLYSKTPLRKKTLTFLRKKGAFGRGGLRKFVLQITLAFHTSNNPKPLP